MATELPIEAERYLANLAEGLRAMPPNERRSLILELRSHFQGLHARGGTAVIDGIADLGPAQALAAEFIAARPAGAAPASVEHLPPDSGARPFTVRAAIRETFATIAGADERLRIVGAVLLATLAVTNFMAFLATSHPGSAMPKPTTLLLRLAGIIVALVAAYRIMLPGPRQPWRIDLPLARYVGAGVTLLAAVMAVQLAIKAAILGAAAGAGLTPDQVYPARVIVAGSVTIAFVFAFLRFQPWMIALATGRSDLTLTSSWRGMRGKTAAMIGTWLLLILPFFMLHYATTAFALSAAEPRFYLPLAAIDGIVTTIQTLLVSALLVTAYRWVADKAVPEPAPFASAEPTREAMEAARRMVIDAIEARYERQMRPFATPR